MSKRIWALSAVAFALAACSQEVTPPIDAASAERGRTLAENADSEDQTAEPERGELSSENANEVDGVADEPATTEAARVDPRKGGFEIALGEWAVTPEAPALRPGPVTFLIHNRGTIPHGFEIELENDSSGSGSDDLFKAESEVLQPGESTRMTVELTRTGIYKIECLVDGHDDMGMEGPLEVSEAAPLLKEEKEVTEAGAGAPSGDTSVAISGFAFDPGTVEVEAGTKVTWSNDDPAPHTVTAEDGDFDSDILDGGQSFSFTFDEPGTYTYLCNVHPDMKGTVKVR
jgi:plastocyanin